MCINSSTNLFAENCPINPASGTSYIQWHSILGGNDVMFASNVANNAANSNYQNFTFSSVGQYQIYYEIGNMVNGVFVPTGGVSFGNYLIVNVIQELPSGSFVPPYNLCENSTVINFNYTGTSGVIDYTLSTIDLGDGNGVQQLTASIFSQLTGLGLNTYYTASPNPYNVIIYLKNPCGSAVFTQSYMVYDQIPITASDISICEGTQSVILSANVPNGVTIEWSSNGNSIGLGNPLQLNPAPISTTTYTATGSLAGGCSNSANLTVNVIPEQTIEIMGSPNNCNSNVSTYFINNPVAGAVYYWTIVGGTPQNATGSQVTITWDPNTWPNGGTIDVISTPAFPCLLPGNLIVEPCCAKGTEYTFYVDGFSDNNTMTNDVSLSQIFANLLPNSNVLSPGFSVPGWTGTGGPYNHIVFGGTIVVDMNLTITNNMIVDLLPNTSIFIMPGYSLTIENGTVLKAACKEMWQGITAFTGSSLTLNSGCIIQDADVGVITGANSHLNFGASGAKVRFNKNHVALAIFNHTSPANVLIKNTVFECRAGAYASDELLLSPYTGEMSAIGIYLLKNLQTLTIGQVAANQNNYFDNLVYGIMATESNFRLFNNAFENISYDNTIQYSAYDCDCKCPTGTAVCANGRQGNYNVTIGGNSLTYPTIINTVTNSDNGFYIYNNTNAYIESNSMLNIKNIGILLSQNYIANGYYTIKRNNLKDIQFNHILLIDNPKTYKTIENNDINVSYTPNYLYSTAIQITEAAKAPLPVTVVDNHIEQVQTGIYTSKVNYLNANNNYFDLNANPDKSQGFGIVVWEGQNHSITNNQIRAANRNNYYVDGIRLEYTPKTTVSCNSMERTGSGVFINGTCTDSKIFQNNMRRNFWGYIINNAITGLQQPNMYCDNIWTGPYDNNTLDGGTYWHTLNIGGSDPFQNTMNVRNHTLPGNVHKPVPFYAKNDMGFSTFNLWPHPINPTDGPIYYPNLYSNTNNPDYGPCINVIATDTVEGDEEMTQQILSNTIQSPQYNLENLWWLKYQLFLSAKADTSIANQSGMQTFIDSVENAPMGKLIQIAELLGDSTAKDSLVLNQLQSQNNLIVASNTIETLFRWINDKAIEITFSETDTLFNGFGLSMIEENDIEALAQECPFEKGPAVFVARALIKKLRPQSPVFINYCERVQPEQDNRSADLFPFEYENDPSEVHDLDNIDVNQTLYNNNFDISLFPNPTNSIIQILVENDQILEIYLFDAIGNAIANNKVNYSKNKSTVDVSNFAQGLYLAKIKTSKGVVSKTFTVSYK